MTNTGLILCPNPTMDQSHLHIAFFLASFGTQPSQALGSIGHLFRHYLPLISSDLIDSHRCSLARSTPVVFAVHALAHSHFGMAHTNPVSVRQGFQSYGMAPKSMSAILAEMKRTDSDLHGISEEDWQYLAFFCLVMAFWGVCSRRSPKPSPLSPALLRATITPHINLTIDQKMKMSPESRNWQNHIRCLVAAIILRGTDHTYSKSNFQLLACSRLLLVRRPVVAVEVRLS